MILVQIFYFFRPYACTICPATFAVDSYLRSHMRSHSGEKRYQCEVCDKKYVSHIHDFLFQYEYVDASTTKIIEINSK